MKKSLIALSVAGLIAGSASAVTVYNNNGTTLEVNGSARVMLTKTQYDRVDLQNDGSRIKFEFSQQIGDGFSALGFMELRPSGDNFDSGITTKYLFAGFQASNIGTLTFGKQKVAGDAFKLADPAEQDFAINDAMGLATTADKAIHFRSADFSGLAFETSYLFDKDAFKYRQVNGTTKSDSPNANGYQLLAKYENTFGEVGVKLHALYSHAKQVTISASGTEGIQANQQVWGVSAGVNVADFGFAVDYAKSKQRNGYMARGLIVHSDFLAEVIKNKNKASGLQVAMTYQLTDPMDIYALYHHYSYQGNTTKFLADKAIVNGFTLGTHYYLSKNVMTYVEYNFDHLSVDSKLGKTKDPKTNAGQNGRKDNRAFVGLRVFF